jgi:N-6 DNA Methylase
LARGHHQDGQPRRIGTALARLEQANPDSLAGIFGDAAWGNKERLPESALVALVNGFNGLMLNPDGVSHDLLGQAYEYLLKNFADESGKKAEEFFTPRQIVKLIVRCLNPQPGESIYDPAAGSGGMEPGLRPPAVRRGGRPGRRRPARRLQHEQARPACRPRGISAGGTPPGIGASTTPTPCCGTSALPATRRRRLTSMPKSPG